MYLLTFSVSFDDTFLSNGMLKFIILHSSVSFFQIAKFGLLWFTLLGRISSLSHYNSFFPAIDMSGIFHGSLLSPSSFSIASYITFPIRSCLYVR